MGTGCCGSQSKVHVESIEAQWQTIIKSQKLDLLLETNKLHITNLIFKGLPNSLRWEMWKKLLRVPNLSAEYTSIISNLTLNSQIDKDIHRTFPRNSIISSENGQTSLKNLLNALSTKYKEKGYWQGMNYIVATSFLVSIGNESETFAFVTTLFVEFGVLSLFDENFIKVGEFCKEFHEGIEKYDKDLEKHLKKIALDDSLWIFKWFITMFTYSFEHVAAIRIWDFLLVKGLTFMSNIAVSIALSLSKDLKNKDLETVLTYLDKIHLDIEKVLSHSLYLDMSTKLKAASN